MNPEPTAQKQFEALPISRMAKLSGWAMYRSAETYVWRPQSADEVRETLEIAKDSGRSVIARGSGYSYGDTALNGENITVDLTRMNKILQWDPQTGVIQIEPGATIYNLWRHTLPDGWWPTVVPGAMSPTIGGCAAVNAHGKNSWLKGTFGDAILSFDLLLANGDMQTVTRESDPELFHAAIGGLGLLGVMTSVTLQTRKVPAGYLLTRHYHAQNLDELFDVFEQRLAAQDEYLVGWIDGFAAGASLGRGLIEAANHPEMEDVSTLNPATQDLSPNIAGVFPRSQMWRIMNPLFHDAPMRLANNAQYTMVAKYGAKMKKTPMAQFHFFHDYIPNWKKAFAPGGLRQFQMFAPAESAKILFRAALQATHDAHIPPYLCVFKRHKTDPFLLRYQSDGYSLSLDFRVTRSRDIPLQKLLEQLRVLVLENGGNLYMAKDDFLDAASFEQSVGADRAAEFRAIKDKLDPAWLFQSNLSRRIMPQPLGEVILA